MLLSSIQVEMNSTLIRNQQSQPVQTDDESRCFWIENQYRTDRAVKAILSHFKIHLHSLIQIESYSNRIRFMKTSSFDCKNIFQLEITGFLLMFAYSEVVHAYFHTLG